MSGVTSSTTPPKCCSWIAISAGAESGRVAGGNHTQPPRNVREAHTRGSHLQANACTQMAGSRRTVRSPLIHRRLHNAAADELCRLVALCQHLLHLLRIAHASGGLHGIGRTLCLGRRDMPLQCASQDSPSAVHSHPQVGPQQHRWRECWPSARTSNFDRISCCAADSIMPSFLKAAGGRVAASGARSDIGEELCTAAVLRDLQNYPAIHVDSTKRHAHLQPHF